MIYFFFVCCLLLSFVSWFIRCLSCY